MKKKDGRHFIPKEQQLKMTAYNQKCLLRDYLNGKSLNEISKNAGAYIGKRQKVKGKAVETWVYKLFVGGYKNGSGGWIRREPLFDKMFDRTGHPFNAREIRMIHVAINHNRRNMLVCLTGRNEEELTYNLNVKSLFN